jgi:hypothetical protein
MSDESEIMLIAARINEQHREILAAIKSNTEALQAISDGVRKRDNALKAALESLSITVSAPEIPTPIFNFTPPPMPEHAPDTMTKVLNVRLVFDRTGKVTGYTGTIECQPTEPTSY